MILSVQEHLPILSWAHFSIQCTLSWAERYRGADVQPRHVGLPADGPEEAVHLPDGADLLLAVLLWVFGDERHLQSRFRFTHGLHLRILPQVHTRVLQLFGAICAYEAVEVPQHLERESVWDTCICITAHFWKRQNFCIALWFCGFLTSACRIMRDVLDPKVERMPAISTAI